MPKPGDTRTYIKHVTAADFAAFADGVVHRVCSTFALAQAAEWAGRLFVLELKAADEEGIGTYISIRHVAPAFEHDVLEVTATLQQHVRNEISCSFTIWAAQRLVAEGETGQKILKKDKLAKVLAPKKS